MRDNRPEMHGLPVDPTLRERRRKKIVLFAQLGVLALALFAAPIAHYALTPTRVTATASSAYSPDYDAEMAIDGNPETEWCLPDNTLGHIDLIFSNKRRVHSLDLTNGHNTTYLDRAIRRARIVVYDGDRAIERHEIELPGIEPKHKRRRITLGGHRATRVRLEVLEFAGLGSALAELAVY